MKNISSYTHTQMNDSYQEMPLLIRFQKQDPSQMTIQINSSSKQMYFYTSRFNQDLVVIGQLVVSMKRLNESSTWTKLQQNNFLQKLQQKSSQIQKYSQTGQMLYTAVQMNGLQFVRGYRIQSLNLLKYNVINDERWQYGKAMLNKIPQQVTAIHFPGLSHLNLSYCQIDNIESLSFINAPCLEEISLKRNNIFNFSSLQKCHFPKLFFINMEKNPIINVQMFYRANVKYYSIQPINYLQQKNGSLGTSFKFLFEKILVEKKCVIYMLMVSILRQVHILKDY